MKKHVLIFITTVWFTLLFYNQSVGLNLSILGFVLVSLTCYKFPLAIKQTNFKIALVSCILILISNAWLFGPEMLIMTFISLALLRVYAQYYNFALFLTPLVVPIQGIATIVRVFICKEWLVIHPTNKSQILRKYVAYIVIPFIFISVFIFTYIASSSTLSTIFKNASFSINPAFFGILLLGFYFMFSFWDGWIYSSIQTLSKTFKPNFLKTNQNKKYFLPQQFELKSGLFTLSMLNIFLFIFILIYSYEQFFKAINLTTLSQDTHQRVYSLISTIVMAIVVILFFFKGQLNFISNKSLKRVAYLWMVLNIVLIAITAVKNLEYIMHLGLTYQRLGVFWFLILCAIGLVFTYFKVSKTKTNFYLINKMSWAFYIGLVLVVVPNWSALITNYNLAQSNLDQNYLENEVRYNEKQLLNHYQKQPESNLYNSAYSRIEYKQQFYFLSKELYYETINLANYPKPVKPISTATSY